jgi:hypothetical protein
MLSMEKLVREGAGVGVVVVWPKDVLSATNPENIEANTL